jgi:uncharacterized protein YacL
MTVEFFLRVAGAIVFAILGANLGASVADAIDFPRETAALILMLVGVLFGIVLTPWFTTRPVRLVRRAITELTVERLLLAIAGAGVGLLLAGLAAYPLSLLPAPFGAYLPAIFTLMAAYLGATAFAVRQTEIMEFVGMLLRPQGQPQGRWRKLIVDTSALIDGRIVDIAETNFIGGTLIIPRFVLGELHRGADSSDTLRRNRFRRGLNVVSKLQREEFIPARVVEDDFEHLVNVDDKLVALALEIQGALITNDYNLGQVAEAQGIIVLNVNVLANAVRSVVIPGEKLAIRVIQAGREPNQGVGYLDDGTMILVENGAQHMDRVVEVVVSKLINRETGRMIFAELASEATTIVVNPDG